MLLLPYPVALELPLNMDMHLQMPDLRNVMSPWPPHPHLFSRLSLRDRQTVVTILKDERFGVLDVSPHLEHLPLLRVGHKVPVRDCRPPSPKRILKFQNLVFLTLENYPMVIKYTLACMVPPNRFP